ncbi:MULTISPECIES: BA14K family protein [unclassified Sinorhizobium]|uniref:BA14K family protein n=1 Tax=unclassified Sinorhizobium TaxID=2613772 RepID=UPI00352400AE
MKKLAIIILSATTAFTGVAPAEAFPLPAAMTMPGVEASSDVQQVDHRRFIPRYGSNNPHIRRWDRENNSPRSYFGRYSYRDGYYRGDYYRDGYYRRRHYRRYDHGDAAAAIIGGLATGAIIGALASQPRYYGGNGHANWCYSRYRSYRAWDNTYQPYYGPRRQCVSPY